ncbi:thioesterase family protein [Mycobacterium malmoense]|uniref:Thioesterase n=1 Tax=Mycobacterium malmoense TaxID=1780 RepID=A0ABX3SMK0_MYCMA|nr:thioesterase family protein [Mycobacterium malmoense]OIN78621.1 thioesterase [Mycobacterium malmoense]ORA78001.1 thioesterase [Mycobacterium malmoense]QZA17952.1 thioesterase family protein [Mycobacterium malmoense]UNB94728.1 thioesterase family protein [Mycobacterium malmoense]
MTDCYYELIDDTDPLGEKFRATDLVRSTWSAAIQHAAPVSALLVRALERCDRRDDTRLSRVVVDLLGPVPAEGELWVRSRLERGGKQIELVGAEMLGLGPDGLPRPVARASGWRLHKLDTAALAHAAAPLPGPLTEARSRDLAKDWDRNYVHSLDWRWLTAPLNDGPGESWITPTVDLVKGETMTQLERLFAVADCANGIGSKLDITRWTFLNTDLAVHMFRIPDGDWVGIRAETNYGPDGIGTTVGTLFDEHGAVGAIQQSVLVRPRPGRTSGGAKIET